MPEQQQDILITIIVASVFFVLLGVFFVVLLFLFLRRQRKNQREKEEMQIRFDKTLLNTQIEIQAQTLSYIASEIHDNIGQILYLSSIHLAQLTTTNLEEKLLQIEPLIERAHADLRSISHSLKHNSFHQIGLVESIQQLLNNIEKTGKYQTEFNLDESDEADLSIPEKDIILFRIVQEIINNILKHAAATHISVSMLRTKDTLNISVTDNGKGFDTEIIKKDRQGIGLENIFNRSKLINTSVDIISSLGNGTTITLRSTSTVNK